MVLYFPYFRGRQYELLALRDLASNRLISTRILPIIEPVKMTTTFLSVLQVFKETALSVGIVMNPSVGELGMGEGTNLDLLELIDSKLIIPSVLIKKNAEGCLDNLREKKGVLDNQLISVLENRDELDTYRVHLNEDSHIYTLIPDARIIKNP